MYAEVITGQRGVIEEMKQKQIFISFGKWGEER